MSTVTRTVPRDRIEELYSAESLSCRNGIAAKPGIRVADSLHISDAALQKYQNWKEQNSAESVHKQSFSTEFQEVGEAPGAPDVAQKTAVMDEIRKAFISALKKYHPDKHYHSDNREALDVAENRTREILAAYEEIQKAYRNGD